MKRFMSNESWSESRTICADLEKNFAEIHKGFELFSKALETFLVELKATKNKNVGE